MYKTKRKIIKDWKNKISKGFKPLYESEYPDNFQDVLNNVEYSDIETYFQEQYKYQNNDASYYFLSIDYIEDRIATQQIESVYKEFLQIQRKTERQVQKTDFWNKTRASIYRNCGIDVQYDINNSDEEIKQDIIRCLEKALIINIDWNKFILILSAITNLASVAVSIILAIKS